MTQHKSKWEERLQTRLRGQKTVGVKQRNFTLVGAKKPSSGHASVSVSPSNNQVKTEEPKTPDNAERKRTRNSYKTSGTTPIVKFKFGGDVETNFISEEPTVVHQSDSASAPHDTKQLDNQPPNPTIIEGNTKGKRGSKRKKFGTSFDEADKPPPKRTRKPKTPKKPPAEVVTKIEAKAVEEDVKEEVKEGPIDSQEVVSATSKDTHILAITSFTSSDPQQHILRKEDIPIDNSLPHPTMTQEVKESKSLEPLKPTKLLNLPSKSRKLPPKAKIAISTHVQKPASSPPKPIDPPVPTTTIKQEPEFYPDYLNPAPRYENAVTLKCGALETTLDVDVLILKVKESLEAAERDGRNTRFLRQSVLDSLFS
ncbi:hypothetical protein BCR33DRAFT_762287 [Rhizoclosmatium globosum]|uniref:Uncharacterized protein n=1 Tax=Rhizoclosmatium globosum TaxID=329046 RepID=A0A1Y2CX52_9FUNG|nr:hypothetical protein BCR33DRAFT_762287 [Rhizoclosmatium globosum]|eukprot:ORY51603.1 hypothetical protein BCR33DRAFT_762287 [Rhizoclosmatium globosum]